MLHKSAVLLGFRFLVVQERAARVSRMVPKWRPTWDTFVLVDVTQTRRAQCAARIDDPAESQRFLGPSSHFASIG